MNDILSPENYSFLFNLIIEYAPRIVLGILFLFIGLRIIKRSINLLENFLIKRKIDESLIPFLGSLLSIMPGAAEGKKLRLKKSSSMLTLQLSLR